MSNKKPPYEEPAAATKPPPPVEKILPDDVVLGRGALAIGNEGNIRFRAFVKGRQAEYIATSRRKKKAKIAAEIRADMAQRNARFLCKVEGNHGGKEAWVEADERTVMQKIKQSLREIADHDSETETTPTDQPHASSPQSLKQQESSLKKHKLEQNVGSDGDTKNDHSIGGHRRQEIFDRPNNPPGTTIDSLRAHAQNQHADLDAGPDHDPPQQPPFPPQHSQQFSQPASDTGAIPFPSSVIVGESATGPLPPPASVLEHYISRKRWLQRERQLLILGVEKDREITRQRLREQDQLLEDLRRVQQADLSHDAASSLMLLGSQGNNDNNRESHSQSHPLQWPVSSQRNIQSTHASMAPPIQLVRDHSSAQLSQSYNDLMNKMRRTKDGG